MWQSHTGGGRNNPGDPLSAADWQDLNGQVNPNTAALIHSTGLTITQFVSMQTVPLVPGQYWGGTQDNGTLRKSMANNRWFDQASGDGGLRDRRPVDAERRQPDRARPTCSAPTSTSRRTGTTRRRRTRSSATSRIDGGINMGDRSEFYVPWTENRGNTNQMFLGTYRLYRTDNAEAAERAGRRPGSRSARTSPPAARARRPTARAAA